MEMFLVEYSSRVIVIMGIIGCGRDLKGFLDEIFTSPGEMTRKQELLRSTKYKPSA